MKSCGNFGLHLANVPGDSHPGSAQAEVGTYFGFVLEGFTDESCVGKSLLVEPG